MKTLTSASVSRGGMTVSHILLRQRPTSYTETRVLGVEQGWKHGDKSGSCNNSVRVDII